jgi:hypothetical protein
MSNAFEKLKNERISLDRLCESCGAELIFVVGDALARLEHSEPLEVRCERCGAVQAGSGPEQFQVEVGARLVRLCWPLLTTDEQVREVYRQLLAIGEARLSFALAIEAIRTGSERDSLELDQAQAALGRMLRIYDERTARPPLAGEGAKRFQGILHAGRHGV